MGEKKKESRGALTEGKISNLELVEELLKSGRNIQRVTLPHD